MPPNNLWSSSLLHLMKIIGMPSSSVQPEYVVRSSNAAIAGSNEEQEQMLAVSLNIVIDVISG